jgi:L-fuconolactonase
MKKVTSHSPQGDPEAQEPHQSDHKTDHENVKRPGGISRRGFIMRTVSMVVATDFALSNKLFATAIGGNNSGDPASAVKIIDTHTHFYDPSRAIPVGRDRSVPWPSPGDGPLYRTILPSGWEALAKPLGMSGTVVVEAGTSWLEDNDWILKLAERYPSIVGLIGNLSGTAVDQGVIVPVWDNMTRFRQEVRRLAGNPLFRGIRVTGSSVSGDTNGGHYPHFEALADAGMVIDVNDVPAPDIVALAKAVPALTIVVDHMFGFSPAAASADKWKSDISALAGNRNVVMKVSGLVEGFDSPQTDAAKTLVQCRGALDHVYRTFGHDRLVFGTNWPVSELFGEMSVVKEIVRGYFEPIGKEVLAEVFSGNAKRIYRYADK